MGRTEALVVAALGRSPYDEQLIGPLNASEGDRVAGASQQYDDRGHPVNSETRQRMRDHVRASNEVMQAAGIIEETADAQARDKAIEETLQQETEMGLRRLEVGRVLLVAGVWGVCGLRRRILLYKRYSGGLYDILRQEKAQSSILHIIGAGMPSMGIYQCIEWLGLLGRAAVSGPNEASKWTDQKPVRDYRRLILRRMLDYGFGFIMLNYQMLAILQQLNMWQSNRLLPSFRSLIPFSPYSPLQIPPFPASFTPAAIWSWTTSLIVNVAPLGLVLAYSMASSTISSIIYAPIYKLLPRPVNQTETFLREMAEELDNIETALNTHLSPSSWQPDTSSTADWEPTTSGTSAAPSQHVATLQALEGRPPNRDDSSDEEDHEMSQQTLITFDVEPTEITEAAMGTWSAELRSANEPPPRETTYQITALTMLPPLLAAEGLSSVLAGLALIPLEAIMVRIVARAYRRSAGLGTGDLFAGVIIPWRVIPNIFVVLSMELAITAALWAGFTIGSQAMAGKYLVWRPADEADTDQ